MSLADLIDEAMATGEWYGITVFAGGEDGPRVNLLRNVSTAVCGQCVDPSISASGRLLRLLQDNRASETRDEFDNILG